MNEEEFRIFVLDRVRQALPLFGHDLRVERYLSMRLGHSAIRLDGADPREHLTGRYDSLLCQGNQPLLLVELKRPGGGVSDTDVGQALSYARLLDPPAPLAFVSDGTTHRLVRTVDGRSLDSSEVIDAAALQRTLETAARVAATGENNAIQGLVRSDSRLLMELLTRINDRTLKPMTGHRSDLNRPFAQDFDIPRAASTDAIAHLQNGKSVVAVIGPPQIGRSNVLRQIAATLGHTRPALLVPADVKDPIEFMRRRLGADFGFAITSDEVKSWLTHGARLTRPVIILDDPTFDIDSLLDEAESGNIALVLSLTEADWIAASKRQGRAESTRLGLLATVVSVDLLSSEELETWTETQPLRISATADIRKVAQARHPRYVRVLLADVESPDREDQIAVVDWLASWPTMMKIARSILRDDDDTRIIYERLAAALTSNLESDGDLKALSNNAELRGRLSIDLEAAISAVGQNGLDRLREIAHVRLARVESGARVVFIIEELVLEAVARHWSIKLLSGKVAELRQLVHLVPRIPGGDLVLAAAICAVPDDSSTLFGNLVSDLLDSPPVSEDIPVGHLIRVFTPHGAVDLPSEALGGGRSRANTTPWLVLSQLARFHLDGEDENGVRVELGGSARILETIGEVDFVLRTADEPGQVHDVGHSEHSFNDGSVVCPEAGLLEPMLAAFWTFAQVNPSAFLDMAERALRSRSGFLLWRIHIVADRVRTSASKDVAEAASLVAEVTHDFIHEVFEKVLASHRPDE